MAELKYASFPLPAGTKATGFTVQKILEQIRAGIKSPVVRQKAVQVVRSSGAAPYDQRAEVSALFSFVKHTFHFIKDPTLVELVHTPEKLLEIRSGDCDDFTVILASLLGAVGYETRVAIVGPVKGIYSHTFPEVWLKGAWVPLDATVTDRNQIEQAKKSGNYKTFSLQGGTMLGQPLAVKPSVVVNGQTLFTEIVQETLDYLNAEIGAGRMQPAELGRYFNIVPGDATLTPLMKAAVLKGVELVGSYRFGLSRDQMEKLASAPAGVGFLGGIFKGIGSAIKTVVGGAKKVLGIPDGQPVAVKVEIPQGTNPQPVNVGAGVTAQVVPPSTLSYVGDWFSQNWMWVAGGVAALFLVPKLIGKARR